MNYKTCRVCHKTDFEDIRAMVTFAPRHSAHWQCKLDSLPDRDARIAWLQTLPKHALVTAPFLLLERNGLYEFVAKWVRELEREENLKSDPKRELGISNADFLYKPA